MKAKEFMKEAGISFADLEVLRKSLVESGKMHENVYGIICDIQKAAGFRFRMDSSNGFPKVGSTIVMSDQDGLKTYRISEVSMAINCTGNECSVELRRVG